MLLKISLQRQAQDKKFLRAQSKIMKLNKKNTAVKKN
jgi:hypothetical protein